MARLFSRRRFRVVNAQARPYQKGLTLMEFMIALAVGGILLSLAVPSFTSLIENNRLTADTNNLLATLNAARGAAFKHESRIVLCPTDHPDSSTATCKTGAAAAKDWSSGWLMYVIATSALTLTPSELDYDASDTTHYILLHRGNATYSKDVIKYNEVGGGRHLVFNQDGTLGESGIARFAICDSHKETTGKLISIGIVGQTSVSNTTTNSATNCTFQ